VKKTRQSKRLELGSDSIRTETALMPARARAKMQELIQTGPLKPLQEMLTLVGELPWQ
jgi:hypothetical protein